MDKPNIRYTKMNCPFAFCEMYSNRDRDPKCKQCEEYYKDHSRRDDDDEIPDTHHGVGGPHHWS